MTALPTTATDTGWHVSMPPRPTLTLAPDLSVWQVWADDWRVTLNRLNRSPLTVKNYLITLGKFATWAAGRGRLDPAEVTRRDVSAFVGWQADQVKANGEPVSSTYVAQNLRQLKVFYKFWQGEEELMTNPARDVPLPATEKHLTPVLSDEDLSGLLHAARGSSWVARRDTALLRMLLDTGMRAAELMSLTVEDVDTAEGLAVIRKGKGGEGRVVPFGDATAEALNRYRRARATHPDAHLPQLWLGVPPYRRGRLGTDGLSGMLDRRGRQAGIAGNVHPHRFRHTAYDAMEPHLSGGAAMEIMGWKSRTMLDHYGKSNRQKRAITAARALKLGDRV